MKMMQKSICALAVLATTAMSAQAADSIDVIVKGTITPAACTPTLAGGGVIDYGTMNPSILNATGMTLLDIKDVNFSISCDAPAAVAIKTSSSRKLTAAGVTSEGSNGVALPPATLSIFGATPGTVGVMGLGLSDGKKVGGFGMRMLPTSITADGSAVRGLYSNNSGSTWNLMSSGSLAALTNNEIVSWAANTGALQPLNFENLSGTLQVQAYINEKSALTISKPVLLDGLATMELVYL